MIPFSKPEIDLSNKDLKEIGLIIKNGKLCKGEYIRALENYFKDTYNVKYAKACCNATNGLIIAFKATNLYNTFVVMPSFTWPSTLYAVECSNNIPVWMDINTDTWNMSGSATKFGNEIKRSDYYKKYIRLISTGEENEVYSVSGSILVDIFGNMSYINVPTTAVTIYDAAHSFGNKLLGNRGTVEVVSLSFTKPITSMQGGMILTNNDTIFNKISELVDLSAKMCEVNAFIALKEIEKYPIKRDRRLEVINRYRQYIRVPIVEQKIEYSTNYSTYSVLFESRDKRDKIVNKFKENGIESKVYYEPLIHGLKNTDEVYSRILSLPTYPSVNKHVKTICDLINKA
uniref:Putative DegT/DnrJ/EryC1/StrS aminotransferase family protein n=1 Tax=viral metagenome TaxID=1070528 RepID=A0A6H1ZW27_9ZZZZ